MDTTTLEQRYLRVTKRFAKLAGTWPYQNKSTKYLARAITSLLTVSVLATQVAQVVCFFSTDVLVEEVPFFVVGIGILIKQGNHIINETKFRSLIDGIFDDWVTKRSKEEIDIMTTYAKRGAFFTSLYMGNAYFCVVMFINTPYIPMILDKVLPANTSRNRLMIYPAYYPFDMDKYYYVVMIHSSVIIIVVLIVYSACDTTYMITVQHACGLLAVAGHRFKCAIVDSSDQEKEKSVERRHVAYRKVCYSIQGHKRAKMYLTEIENSHIGYHLVGMVLVMVAFSVTLVKMSVMDISVDFYKYCSFLFIQLVHMLFLMIQGQFVIDSSNEIYDAIYEGLWYLAPVNTQALYLLALREVLTPCEITAGGLVPFNLQTFTEVVKTSVSYFTVFKSM